MSLPLAISGTLSINTVTAAAPVWTAVPGISEITLSQDSPTTTAGVVVAECVSCRQYEARRAVTEPGDADAWTDARNRAYAAACRHQRQSCRVGVIDIYETDPDSQEAAS